MERETERTKEACRSRVEIEREEWRHKQRCKVTKRERHAGERKKEKIRQPLIHSGNELTCSTGSVCLCVREIERIALRLWEEQSRHLNLLDRYSWGLTFIKISVKVEVCVCKKALSSSNVSLLLSLSLAPCSCLSDLVVRTLNWHTAVFRGLWIGLRLPGDTLDFETKTF